MHDAILARDDRRRDSARPLDEPSCAAGSSWAIVRTSLGSGSMLTSAANLLRMRPTMRSPRLLPALLPIRNPLDAPIPRGARRGAASKRLARVAAAAGLAFASSVLAWSAAASDGAVEISQIAALAGGVTASDGPGFPVTLDAPGSYILTSMLEVPSGFDGIEVLADDVSIDLNGFTIRGPLICTGSPPALSCPTGTGRGIRSTAQATRVARGSVTGFADGGVDLAAMSLVTEILSYGNARYGIQVGDQSQVKHARANGNGGDGIVAGADSLVLGNAATGNNDVGIVLAVGAGVASNVVSENGVAPITGGVLLSDNVCDRTGSCSLSCADADGDSAFTNCTPLDCDDNDATSFPGGTEVCDGADNDCDGEIDESLVCNGSPPGVGEVLFSEVLPNPDAVADSDGEWFELYNATLGPLELGGCLLENGPAQHVIAGPLTIASSESLLIGRNGDPLTNGGLTHDYVYGDAFNLSNSSDDLTLRCGGVIVDVISWDSSFPFSSGVSMELATDRLDATLNDLASNWCAAIDDFGMGDLGTPSQFNTCSSPF